MAPHGREVQYVIQKYVFFPGRRRKKTTPWRYCRLGLRAWRTKKPMLCFHVVTDEDGHPLENEDESGRILCEYWCKIFEERVEGERHHCHETLLGYFQKALDEKQWEIAKNEFDEIMATQKRICSWPRWDFIQPLQVCRRVGIYAFIQGLSTCTCGRSQTSVESATCRCLTCG